MENSVKLTVFSHICDFGLNKHQTTGSCKLNVGIMLLWREKRSAFQRTVVSQFTLAYMRGATFLAPVVFLPGHTQSSFNLLLSPIQLTFCSNWWFKKVCHICFEFQTGIRPQRNLSCSWRVRSKEINRLCKIRNGIEGFIALWNRCFVEFFAQFEPFQDRNYQSTVPVSEHTVRTIQDRSPKIRWPGEESNWVDSVQHCTEKSISKNFLAPSTFRMC